jgi:hypothetical protein
MREQRIEETGLDCTQALLVETATILAIIRAAD